MRTITLQKPDGTKFQVNDHRTPKSQANLLVNTRGGYIESAQQDNSEMLLPAGFSVMSDGSIETPVERMRKVTANKSSDSSNGVEDDNMLLPIGVKLKS